MLRLRKMLTAIPIVVILAGFGLAVDTQPANAFVTVQDYCAGYFYGYNYWSNAAFNEWLANGETNYYAYARDQSWYYSYLFTSNNC